MLLDNAHAEQYYRAVLGWEGLQTFFPENQKYDHFFDSSDQDATAVQSFCAAGSNPRPEP